MKYKIVYTKTAAKDIKKLDSVVKKKVGKKILMYLQNPLKYATKLKKSQIGMFRWRAGNYRIVFDMDGGTVIVLRIRHRREIYKQ